MDIYSLPQVIEVLKYDDTMEFDNEDYLVKVDENSGYAIVINKHTNDLVESTLISDLVSRTFTVVEKNEESSVEVFPIQFILIGDNQTLIKSGVTFPNGGTLAIQSLVDMDDDDVLDDRPDVLMEFVSIDAIEAFQDILEDLKDQMLGKCE